MTVLAGGRARDDITDLHAVREKVSDLVSVRRNKVFTGLQNIKSSAPVEVPRPPVVPRSDSHGGAAGGLENVGMVESLENAQPAAT